MPARVTNAALIESPPHLGSTPYCGIEYRSSPANVEPQDLVGRVLGLPIFTDAVLSTSLGGGSGVGTEDSIFVLRAQDIVLYESGVRARVMPEPLAQTLSVLVQLYSYLALAVRFPASIVELTGLSAPVF
jgi:hypothetical protein